MPQIRVKVFYFAVLREIIGPRTVFNSPIIRRIHDRISFQLYPDAPMISNRSIGREFKACGRKRQVVRMGMK
jgi:hypothetical protein